MKMIISLECQEKQDRILGLFRQVMGSGSYAEGRMVKQAEAAVTKLYGGASVSFNSCGSALFAAFSWYRSQGYMSAFIQNNTFYATGGMAIEAGITPILVDSGKTCPSMSLQSLKEAHAHYPNVRLVVLTHVAGWLAKDYIAISEYCQRKNLILVEDCAHVFGLGFYGHMPSSHAECSTWSFYPTKAIPIGEGGMATVRNPEMEKYLRKFSSYGKEVKSGVMTYTRGFNFRMDEWSAAVLIAQIEYLPYMLAARRADAKKLQSIAPCLLSGESNYYKYPVTLKDAKGLTVTGKIYARSDQLDSALRRGTFIDPVPLVNSHAWAEDHACLPCGEGLYRDIKPEDLLTLLKKETHAS